MAIPTGIQSPENPSEVIGFLPTFSTLLISHKKMFHLAFIVLTLFWPESGGVASILRAESRLAPGFVENEII